MTASALLAPVLGIALSPFGLIPAILLQFTPQARANGAAFLAGWSGGIFGAFLLAAALSDLLADGSAGSWIDWLRLLAGAALLGLGAMTLLRDRQAGAMPAWMAGLADSRPPGALRLGAMLSLANPKVLLLAASAGLMVAGGDRTLGTGLLAAGFGFAAAASLLVAMPLALQLLFGPRALNPLDRARQWLIANNSAVTAAMLLLFGLLLIQKAAPALV